MAQSPFLVDVLQLEPSSGDTLTIERNTPDGSMLFKDALVTAGVRLSDLIGVRNLSSVSVVGVGDGAEYNTIQAGIDAVSATASANNPAVVIVTAGVYTENVILDKDGVYLIGQGATLVSNTSNPTIQYQIGPVATPQTSVIQNLKIRNTFAGESCISIVGETSASGTATINTAPLATGDVLTVGGVNLVGIVGTRTSGSNDFDASITDTTLLAEEITAAINDPSNGFSNVRATSQGAVVTVIARTPGTSGNSISLASVTTPIGGITVSGAFLAGGADNSGSPTVASNLISIQNCDLLAEGVGSYQLNADTINNVEIRGGTAFGSDNASILRASQVASLRVFGVSWLNDVELSYDTGLNQPSITTSTYDFRHVGRVNDFVVNLVSLGSLTLGHITESGDIVMGGSQTLTVYNSRLGTLSLSDTVAATLISSNRSTVSVAGGTPTLQESSLTGSVVFTASSLETIAFGIPQPDNSYSVLVDSPILGSIPQATVKATSSFDLAVSGPITGTVYYTVLRQLV